ncbi:MAG: hypothetical protein EPN39_16115 [Chitinophagaceae bacterium]|nr:MAG: hypothetical protein EPN39_16115 [Chitinophagaceae bacterium]
MVTIQRGWIVDGNQIDNNINSYYADLINKLPQNLLFDTYYAEEGDLGNYLEFICYPKGHDIYHGNAILVCVSLCAPIAVFGQTSLSKSTDYIDWGGLFSAEKIGDIKDTSLTSIENGVKSILFQQSLSMLTMFIV